MADDQSANGQVVTLADYQGIQSAAAAGRLAMELHHRVVALVQQIEDRGTALGCLLWQIREDGLFRELGYETFGAYLASPDVHLSRAHSYKLIAIAEAVCPDLLQVGPESDRPLPPAPLFSREDLAAMGVERATMVLPLIRREPARAADWVASAKTLGAGDLQLAIREQGEPSFTQVQEVAFELGRKLTGIGYHLKGTHDDPTPLVVEAVTVSQDALRYLQEITQHDRPLAATPDTPDPGPDARPDGDPEPVPSPDRRAEPVDGPVSSAALDPGVS